MSDDSQKAKHSKGKEPPLKKPCPSSLSLTFSGEGKESKAWKEELNCQAAQIVRML